MKRSRVTAAVCLIAGVSCSNPAPKSCNHSPGSNGASFAVTSESTLANIAPHTPLTGGFVQFHLEKASDKFLKESLQVFSDSDDARCAATFKFIDVNGSAGAEITTATHCFKGMLGLIDSIAVDIYDNDTQTYLPSIPVYATFLEQRNTALAELFTAGFNQAARQTVSTKFMNGYVDSAGLSNVFDRNLMRSCGVKSSSSYEAPKQFYSKVDYNSLCFTATDIAVIEVAFEKKNGLKKLSPRLAEILSSKRKEQDAALTLVDQTPNALLAKNFYASSRQKSLDLKEHGFANYMDYIALGCPASKTPNVPSAPSANSGSSTVLPAPAAEQSGGGLEISINRSILSASDEEVNSMKLSMSDICPQLPKFRSIMDKYMNFRGKTVQVLEKEINFSDPIAKGPAWEQIVLYAEKLPGFGENLPDLIEQAQSNLGLLKLHFNLASFDRSTNNYTSVKIKEISKNPGLLDFDWPAPKSLTREQDSVFVNVLKWPTNTANFDFAAGDSGTILSWNGAYPIFVLAVVDGKPSSGGASLINLPRRKVTEADSPETNSAESAKLKKVESATCLY